MTKTGPDTTVNGVTGTINAFTTPGGSVTAQFDGPNAATDSGTAAGKTGVSEGDLAILSSNDSKVTTSGGGSFESFANVVGLSYADFGVWALNPCSNSSSCLPSYVGGYAGAKAGQIQTATMPKTGTATFTGGAVGYVLQPTSLNSGKNNAGEFYGAASVSANFATNAVTGTISGINAYSVNNGGNGQTKLGTVNTISLTATISGSGFAGTTSASTTAGTAFNIAGATGKISGGFYGPSANEIAAVFNLSATNGTQLMGSLGAKQAASDRRLKEEIVAVGTLPNGLRLYSWRYLGGHHRFTGVMAQEVLADSRFADAVAVDGDGLMRVDYALLGYRPENFATMRAEGEAAVAVYNRTVH